MNRAIEDELRGHFERLPENEQVQVLEYVRALASKKVRGGRGSDLTRFAGTIPMADLEMIEQAIEEGCEQVDREGWLA